MGCWSHAFAILNHFSIFGISNYDSIRENTRFSFLKLVNIREGGFLSFFHTLLFHHFNIFMCMLYFIVSSVFIVVMTLHFAFYAIFRNIIIFDLDHSCLLSLVNSLSISIVTIIEKFSLFRSTSTLTRAQLGLDPLMVARSSWTV